MEIFSERGKISGETRNRSIIYILDMFSVRCLVGFHVESIVEEAFR